MDAPLDPTEFAAALWRFRLRGIAAADALAAHERSRIAHKFAATRPDPLLKPMRGFICEYDPDLVYDPMRQWPA